MFKTLPLRDWLIYCERHGMPGFIGKTGARKGSDEWQAMVEAVGAIAANYAAVVSKDDDIAKLETAASGSLPYPGLVERMDRAMAALLRGADLSTISAGEGEGQGASLQGDESDLLEQDDCALISETLQEQVDPFVIRYALGDDVPLAYFELVPRKRPNVTQDILIDRFFIEHGGRISITDAMQRYGRTPAADADEVLAPAALPPPVPVPAALINEATPGKGADAPQVGRILEAGRLLYAGALQADWKAVADRLNSLFAQAESWSPEDLSAALAKLEADLPRLLPEDPQTARVLAASAALELGAAGGVNAKAAKSAKSEGRDPKAGGEA